MKPKNEKAFLARLTAFASSPKFTKEVTPTELYSELGRIVRDLIVAQDNLAKYTTKYPEVIDAAKVQLEFIEHSLEMDLIKLWGFLGRRNLRPLNRRQGVAWKRWRYLVRDAKKDGSVLDHLEPAHSVAHQQEEFVA